MKNNNLTSKTKKPQIYTQSFAVIYQCYLAKAKKKNRTKLEVDIILCWLTGYSQIELETQIKKEISFEAFFDQAPKLNPNQKLIRGRICGIKSEEITQETMREIRYLDKLIDELAQGKTMEQILPKK